MSFGAVHTANNGVSKNDHPAPVATPKPKNLKIEVIPPKKAVVPKRVEKNEVFRNGLLIADARDEDVKKTQVDVISVDKKKKIGTLEFDDTVTFGRLFFKKLTIGQKIQTFENGGNSREIGYNQSTLKVYDQRDGFVKISLAPEGWIKLSDLPGKAWAPNYAEFFSKESQIWKGFRGYRVRKFASTAAPVVVKLIENGKVFHVFETTGKVNGRWIEVTVKEATGDRCGKKKFTGKTFEGWIRPIKSDGTPDIWFYSRGC